MNLKGRMEKETNTRQVLAPSNCNFRPQARPASLRSPSTWHERQGTYGLVVPFQHPDRIARCRVKDRDRSVHRTTSKPRPIGGVGHAENKALGSPPLFRNLSEGRVAEESARAFPSFAGT